MGWTASASASMCHSDAVIGMADGLTVPFALTVGLSAAVSSTHIIVTAGLAEIAAGAIAMGLGGYLAAKTDREHYDTEAARERQEIRELRDDEIAETKEFLRGFGIEGEPLDRVVTMLAANETQWVDFVMRFELGLERPDPKRAPLSALTIAGFYLIGGFIPLLPYILLANIKTALLSSVVLTGMALIIFGAVKGRLTGVSVLKAGGLTLLVGGLAAGAAFYLAALFG
jgi:vacuolar iron transporter family protein